MSVSGEPSEDLYCYTKDYDKDEEPTLEKCDTGGCMLSYTFNKTYYDADGSRNHLEGNEEGERDDLKVLTAKCIMIAYYEESGVDILTEFLPLSDERPSLYFYLYI
jgi:hypothetical protein